MSLRHKYAGEALTAVAALTGWGLFTSGIAAFAPAHARAVWLLSGGVLFLSLCGWQLLKAVVTKGLYTLTRD